MITEFLFFTFFTFFLLHMFKSGIKSLLSYIGYAFIALFIFVIFLLSLDILNSALFAASITLFFILPLLILIFNLLIKRFNLSEDLQFGLFLSLIIITVITSHILLASFSNTPMLTPFYLLDHNVTIDLEKDYVLIHRVLTFKTKQTFHELYTYYDYQLPVHKPEIISLTCSEGYPKLDDYSIDNAHRQEFICRKDEGFSPGVYTLDVVYKIYKPYVSWNGKEMYHQTIFTSVTTPILHTTVKFKNALKHGSFPPVYKNGERNEILSGPFDVFALYKGGASFDSFEFSYDKLEKDMNRYAFVEQYSLPISLFILFASILLIMFIYIVFSREYGIPYSVIHAPPKDKPWLVNLLFVGNPYSWDDNVIPATLLDLKRRGYLTFKDKTIVLENKEDGLDEYELKLFNFLKLYGENINGKIVFDTEAFNKKIPSFSLSKLREIKSALDEIRHADSFKPAVKLRKESFDKSGEKIIYGLGFVYVLLSFFFVFLFRYLYSYNFYYILLTLFEIGMVLIVANEFGTYLFGRYKREFIEKKYKWDGFRALISDYGNLSKYGPQELSMWDEWLVYATVLGVGNKVIKFMKDKFKVKLPYIEDVKSPLYFYPRIYNSTNTAIFSKTPHLNSNYSGGGFSSGSFSSFGGGFGGGGFGAR